MGFGISFKLALPSPDGELALLSRGWFFFFSGGWPFLLGPSFLLSVVPVPSWNGRGLALHDESWPCCMEREEIGFLLSLSFPW